MVLFLCAHHNLTRHFHGNSIPFYVNGFSVSSFIRICYHRNEYRTAFFQTRMGTNFCILPYIIEEDRAFAISKVKVIFYGKDSQYPTTDSTHVCVSLALGLTVWICRHENTFCKLIIDLETLQVPIY